MEKLAFIQAVDPKVLLKELEQGTLSRYDRENYSLQLRNRDWGRTLQSLGLLGGASMVGGGIGNLLGKTLPSRWYRSGPEWSHAWASALPTLLGGAAGSAIGRQLEMAILDPEDRVYYASPQRLKTRLEEAQWPLLGPSMSTS